VLGKLEMQYACEKVEQFALVELLVLGFGLRSCVLSEGLETAVEGGRFEVYDHQFMHDDLLDGHCGICYV
jgi:hypothetical protein